MEKQRVLVEIGGTVTSEEVKKAMATLQAIADRDKGFASWVEGNANQTILPGMEMILAMRMGDVFDPIIRHRMQYALPAGQFVAMMVVLPLAGG